MKVNLVKRKNPQNKAQVKWYGNAVNLGTKTLVEIADEIAGRSSLTRGDILNVLANFVDCLPPALIDGFSIQMGEFGTLRISLSSKGAATAKDFNTKDIRPRIIFTPGVSLKKHLKGMSFEVVKK